MSRCWGLVGVLLIGCEGGGVPIEKYCDEFMVAQCEGQKRCGYLSGSANCSDVAPLVDCLSSARNGLDAGTLKYDALAAATCLDDLRTDTTCGAVLYRQGSPPSCQNVVTGIGKDGDACGTCSTGLGCVRGNEGCGICRTLSTSSVPLPAVGELCSSPLGDGAGCQNDAWCGESSDAGTVCVRSAAPGESCANSPCVRTATCVGGVCEAQTDLGASCGAAGCLGGLACINNVCEHRRALGVACSAADECWSSLCIDGVCSRGRKVGESCQLDVPCEQELGCENGTCARRPGNGEACSVACAAGSICQQGTCVDLALQICR